jgi:hypothetical protein
METVVKRTKRETSIEVHQKVARFQGTETEVHYKVANLTPEVDVTEISKDAQESFKRETVITVEIESSGDITQEQQELIRRIEADYKSQKPAEQIHVSFEPVKSLEQPKAAAAADKPAPTSKKKTNGGNGGKKQSPAAIKPENHKSGNNSSEKKSVTLPRSVFSRKLVFNKDNVKLVEGDKELSNFSNVNKLKTGTLKQGDKVTLKLQKDKTMSGEVKSIIVNNYTKQCLVAMKTPDNKVSRVSFATILDY